MSSLKQRDGLYELPFFYVFRFTWIKHFLFSVPEALIIILMVITIGDPEKPYFFTPLMIFFGVVWACLWFATYRAESYLKVTDEYLEYKNLFIHKSVLLRDIGGVDIIMGRGEFMGIVSSERKAQSGILHNIFHSKYFLRVPASTILSDINFDKLRLTIIAASKIAKEK